MASKNVILICADEWRGDCLSAAGHPHVQTPHLDELAADGVLFPRAYSATPTCVPARVALFTGQSQERHGRVGYEERVPFDAAHPVTLAGEFSRAGYQTQAIGKMHVHPERSRAGFEHVLLHDGYLHAAREDHGLDFPRYDDYVPWLRSQPGVAADEEYADHGVGCNSTVARPWDKAERLHPSSWAGSEAVSWLARRDPTRPFFLYLSFHRPHPPYDPPAWAFEQYLALPPWERRLGNWEHHYEPVRDDGLHQAPFARLDPRAVHRARAGYYGHMAHIDLQIGRLREALGREGLAQDTVLAFTSDHGEMLGDHDFFRKAVGYEGSARVPLIVADPDARRRRSPGERRRHDGVVELRDVMPTLLDLAGLPARATCDGKSLAAVVRGSSGEPVREWLHGEHVYFGQSLQWITDGRVKYLWASGWGTEELFDLEADPHEMANLAEDPAHAGLLELWRGRLIEALAGREEGFVHDGALVTGRPVVTMLAATRARVR